MSYYALRFTKDIYRDERAGRWDGKQYPTKQCLSYKTGEFLKNKHDWRDGFGRYSTSNLGEAKLWKGLRNAHQTWASHIRAGYAELIEVSISYVAAVKYQLKQKKKYRYVRHYDYKAGRTLIYKYNNETLECLGYRIPTRNEGEWKPAGKVIWFPSPVEDIDPLYWQRKQLKQNRNE